MYMYTQCTLLGDCEGGRERGREGGREGGGEGVHTQKMFPLRHKEGGGSSHDNNTVRLYGRFQGRSLSESHDMVEFHTWWSCHMTCKPSVPQAILTCTCHTMYMYVVCMTRPKHMYMYRHSAFQ